MLYRAVNGTCLMRLTPSRDASMPGMIPDKPDGRPSDTNGATPRPHIFHRTGKSPRLLPPSSPHPANPDS